MKTLNANPAFTDLLFQNDFDFEKHQTFVEFYKDYNTLVMRITFEPSEKSTSTINMKPKSDCSVINFTDSKFDLNPLRVGGAYRVLKSTYCGRDNEFVVREINGSNKRARYRDPAFTVSNVSLKKKQVNHNYKVDSEGYVKGSWNP